MINPIGSIGLARGIETLRSDKAKGGAATAKTAASATDESSAVTSLFAALVAEGAPIDSAKVDAIRTQISAGTYRIDAQAIADKMIAADLPAAR